jgi:hypothetical protein
MKNEKALEIARFIQGNIKVPPVILGHFELVDY